MAGLGLHLHRAALGLNPVAHAHQPVGRLGGGPGLEADTVVAHAHLHPVGLVGAGRQRHPDIGGTGVFAEVGDRLLHHPVDHQLGPGAERHGVQVAVHADARALGKLTQQDLQRGRQPQMAEGGRPQVLNDAAAQRDAAVELVDQVGQPGLGLGRAVAQARADARGVQLGGCQQRAQVVVQVAGQALALVLAGGLQVAGQVGELGGALGHLDLQLVMRGLHLASLFGLGAGQRVALAQVEHQRQQQHRDQRGHPKTAEQQGAVEGAVGEITLLDLQRDELAGYLAYLVHVLFADAREHQLDGGLALAVLGQPHGLVQL